jgi:hypothetical protein
MNKFDKRVKQLLNEGPLGNFVKGTLTAGANFVDAAQNPSKGVEAIMGAAGNINKKKEEMLRQPFSVNNPPKMGQIVFTETSIWGKGNPTTTRSGKIIPAAYIEMQGATKIIGKITKEMKDGVYGVQLTDAKGNPDNQYVFAQINDPTGKIPLFKIFFSNKIDDADVVVDARGLTMKFSTINTGNVNNVENNLKSWRDYNYNIKNPTNNTKK